MVGIVWFAIPLLLFLKACTQEPAEPFRVGSNIWLGYEMFYLARDLGHFDRSTIRLVEFPNATDVMMALRSGVIEAATLTLDEVLTVVQDGYDLRVAAILDFSRGGDVLLARSKIDDLAELRGRRIGVEYTAVGAILLDAALTRAGLSIKDIELVAMTLDEHEAEFVKGSIDAVVTFEPVRSRLLAAGAKELFSSREIPKRIVDVLVVRADAAARREQELRQLLRGYFLAHAYMQTDFAEAARLMAPRLKLSMEQLRTAYAGLDMPDLAENQRLLSGNPAPMVERVRHLVDYMLRREMLLQQVSVEALFDNRWLPTWSP